MAEIIDIKYGSAQVNKVYSQGNLVFEKAPLDTTAPITSPRPYDAINNPTNTYTEAQTVWLDCNEMADTYYTLDGNTPTTASTRYIGGGIPIDSTTTIKYFSVDVAGNTEAVKTTVYTIDAVQLPTTTISPTNTTQNSIPFTVTLTTDEVGATIYYKLGSGAQKTYTGPFSVNQSSAGVQSTNITVAYWAEGADGAEAQKTITYNTSGAVPSQPTVTATAGNGQVVLDWNDTLNSTAWTVYRSTVSGQLGAPLADSQFLWMSTYTDTTAVNETTYYYTVRSQNYSGNFTDSDQKSATPVAPVAKDWRYLKIEGYGATEAGQTQTTRMMEVEAFSGATNVIKDLAINATHQAIDSGSKDPWTLADGVKTTTANTYPIWWLATPNANVIFDLGAVRSLTKLAYYGYSTAGVPRANRFRILGSNTNNGTDWVLLWDMKDNTEMQPPLPAGYEKTL